MPKAYRSDFRKNAVTSQLQGPMLAPVAPQASVLPLDHCDLDPSVWIHLLVFVYAVDKSIENCSYSGLVIIADFELGRLHYFARLIAAYMRLTLAEIDPVSFLHSICWLE